MNKGDGNWEGEVEDIFEVERFRAIGKETDYIFQALSYAGESSYRLAIASTILRELDEVPKELKDELKDIQQQLNEFKEKLRNACYSD